MDDASGESMELVEEVLLKELGEAELERLVRDWWREDDVDGRASVPKDEERVLRGLNCDEDLQIWRLGGCENFVAKWEELVFNALSYL